MNINSSFKFIPMLAILVLLFMTASTVWAVPVYSKYVGTGYDTTVDNLDDGWPVSISLADAMGTFGASKSEITAEFMPQEVECQPGYDGKFALLFSVSVTTYENQSQLIGYSDQGWLCANLETGHYYGQIFGVYSGGTGKFEGATGEFMSEFEGNDLEPPTLARVGFRTISGVSKGNVILP